MALRGVHAGASFLHHHGVHDVREPAGLSARVQPAGGERGGAAVHGHSDLLSHGVPGEEKLHSQVGRALSTLNLKICFQIIPVLTSDAVHVPHLTRCCAAFSSSALTCL